MYTLGDPVVVCDLSEYGVILGNQGPDYYVVLLLGEDPGPFLVSGERLLPGDFDGLLEAVSQGRP